jgi:hypothetical protein
MGAMGGEFNTASLGICKKMFISEYVPPVKSLVYLPGTFVRREIREKIPNNIG